MTTPARNVNTTLTRPGYFYQKNTCTGGYTLQTSSNNRWKLYYDVRPASINNPRDALGWRNPSAWSHDHLEAIVSPIGEMTTKNWCANKKDFTGSRHLDGEYATDSGMLTYITGPAAWLGNLANTRAYLALKSQDANLGEAFAEWHKTQEMVTSGATDIAKQVRQFRKSYPKQWAQVVRNGAVTQWRGIPNRWLELQYGWKPLMSDIMGALKNCDRWASSDKGFRIRVKGAAKNRRYNVVQLATSPYWWKEYISYEDRVKTVLWYKLNHPTVATLASLGLTNPLELGWELVRFSFVVDWFLPVGNWLSTLDADFGWTYLTGTQSTFTNIEVKSVPGHIPDTVSAEYRNYTVGPSAKGFRFRRTVLASPPGVGLPRFKNPLSASHVANALALLVQAFR
jgi:hypothetical protein